MEIDNTLAPIVLFVYNRSAHTLQTLEALSANPLASASILYIFADGPKADTADTVLKSIEETQKVIREKKWCGEVIITESSENRGLAKSIVEGVTEVVNKHGKVIVLEDDIVTSPGFLKYMNDALNVYASEEKVMHISGYMFPVEKKLPETFFYNTASCWGWGTWKRAWRSYNDDAQFLLDKLIEQDAMDRFNVENTYPFTKQLKLNAEGKTKTWAVKWYASFFLQNGFALHPYPSLVNNIGNDGSGINSGNTDIYYWKKLAKTIQVKKQPLQESLIARRAMRSYYKKRRPLRLSFKQKMKVKGRKYIPKALRHQIMLLLNSAYKAKYIEEQRLRKLPRYKTTSTLYLDNKPLQIADSASFLFMYKEIFEREIYKFRSIQLNPRIVDCGANIGMSIIYFKKLLPNAHIIAFEPDKNIFTLLQENINAFNLQKVELINKGLWKEDTILRFVAEGADGGRLASKQDKENLIEIVTTKLSTFLNESTDFLKIDIEGAELVVLEECQDQLHNVQNIFVEYHSFTAQDQHLDKLLNILKQAGFRYYIDSPGLTSKNPYIKIRELMGMDMQLNIYGIRS